MQERAAVIKDIRRGSTVIVPCLDRFGLSGADIIDAVVQVTDKGAEVKALNTGLVYGCDNIRELFADAKLAETTLKRENICKARRVLATSNVKVGRKPKLTTKQIKELCERWRTDDRISQADLAEAFGVSPSTARRLCGNRGIDANTVRHRKKPDDPKP